MRQIASISVKNGTFGKMKERCTKLTCSGKQRTCVILLVPSWKFGIIIINADLRYNKILTAIIVMHAIR